MAIIKKSLVILAYLGLLTWTLFIAFHTRSLPNESLVFHYGILILYASLLFNLKLGAAAHA
ncbi:MAG: hypothetical protein WEB87_02220 [Bacteriovoracaceae bacterium]